jgi:hypothetical protein
MKAPFMVIIPLAILSLILGIWGGWIRMGWGLPIPTPVPVSSHGVFMVDGFLGTLISLKRVATLHKIGLFVIPLTFGLSMPLFLLGLPHVSQLFLILGSVGYASLCIYNYLKYKHEGEFLLLIGAAFQLLGHVVLTKTNSYPMAFAAWMLFLIFTIVGERLDLTKFLPRGKYQKAELYFWLLAITLSSAMYHIGAAKILGFSLIGLSQWLIRNDIALVNITKTNNYKFLGISLLVAFAWLATTGIIGFLSSPFLYDALLHSFFIGFVFNMILAHAPIIFPALLKINHKPFHPVLYLWLVLLNLALAVRIIGDFIENSDWRLYGALFNGLAFIGYLVNVAFLILKNQLYEKNYQIRSI